MNPILFFNIRRITGCYGTSWTDVWSETAQDSETSEVQDGVGEVRVMWLTGRLGVLGEDRVVET